MRVIECMALARLRETIASGDTLTREAMEAEDHQDALLRSRAKFHLPPGLLYFDGNSLGPLPKKSRERLLRVIDREWGEDLVRSWNVHRWIDWPRTVGSKIAQLIGAESDEVVVADSTSVNLFKLMSAALELRPGRSVILSEDRQFPTDLYMAQGLAHLRTDVRMRTVERSQLTLALDEDVAVLVLTHVDYRSGQLHDMAAMTRAAHERGALVLWDLSHSTGALPVDLNGCYVDLAVGCGYKFLNGGPGAPGFLYVARRWQQRARSPLAGWLGHRSPFAFEPVYRPALGIERFRCGTPPILSLAAFDAALDLFDDLDLESVWSKAISLGDTFLALVEQQIMDPELKIACPLEGRQRGSQISLRHPQAFSVMQALIERGVVGDFREPDILRFGLGPLYTSHVNVWDAVQVLKQVLKSRAWDTQAFRVRKTVT